MTNNKNADSLDGDLMKFEDFKVGRTFCYGGDTVRCTGIYENCDKFGCHVSVQYQSDIDDYGEDDNERCVEVVIREEEFTKCYVSSDVYLKQVLNWPPQTK